MSSPLALWGSFPLVGKNKKSNLNKPSIYRGAPASRIKPAANIKGLRGYVPAILLFGNIALAIVYFFGVNQNAAKGYELKKVTAKLNQFTDENKKLIVKTAEMGSILEVQQSSSLAQFVSVDSAEYLQVNQLSQR